MSTDKTYNVDIRMAGEDREVFETRVSGFGGISEYIEHLVQQDLRPRAKIERTRVEEILSEGMVDMMREMAPILSSLMVDDIVLNYSIREESECRMVVDVPDFEEIEKPYMDRYRMFVQYLNESF